MFSHVTLFIHMCLEVKFRIIDLCKIFENRNGCIHSYYHDHYCNLNLQMLQFEERK